MWQTLNFNRSQKFMSISLKGFSQVMLMENALSGGLILLGITIHSPLLGLIALISSMIGTLVGKRWSKDKLAVQQGIYGFNSILCGIAVVLFLQSDWRWLIVPFAAAIATFVMMALQKMLASWKIPILTYPFLLVTWIGLLITYKIDGLHINPTFVTTSPAKWNLPIEGTPHFFIGLIKGVGEVFIIDSIWAGSLILIALFVAGWRFGMYAIGGTFISWITALSLGVDTESLNLGLYNYNAVLTMIAVGLVFDEKKRYFPLVGVFAAAVTVPITAGIEILLLPLGLPALTSPFVISTWLFLMIRKAIPKMEL